MRAPLPVNQAVPMEARSRYQTGLYTTFVRFLVPTTDCPGWMSGSIGLSWLSRVWSCWYSWPRVALSGVEPEVFSVELHSDRVGRCPVSKVRDRGITRHEVGEDESHHGHP